MNRRADLSLGVRRLAAAFLTSGALLVAVAAIFLCFGVTSLHAQAQPQTQTPGTSPSHQTADKAKANDADKAQDADKAKDDEEDNNPFAPEPAPPLPPAITGSDATDPR